MSIFSMIFSRKPEKDIHIHLHVDGILKLNGVGNAANMKNVANLNSKVELVDSMPEMEPEKLGDIKIPNIDFGDEDIQ